MQRLLGARWRHVAALSTREQGRRARTDLDEPAIAAAMASAVEGAARAVGALRAGRPRVDWLQEQPAFRGCRVVAVDGQTLEVGRQPYG